MAWSKKARFLSPVEVLENPEEWDYFTDLELMKSRGSSICMTCEHFTYTCDKSCVTLLTCPLHQRLIPQGEHLTKRCRNWQQKSHTLRHVEFLFSLAHIIFPKRDTN